MRGFSVILDPNKKQKESPNRDSHDPIALSQKKKGFPVQQHGKSKACTSPPIPIPYSFKIVFISNLLTWVDLQAHHKLIQKKHRSAGTFPIQLLLNSQNLIMLMLMAPSKHATGLRSCFVAYVMIGCQFLLLMTEHRLPPLHFVVYNSDPNTYRQTIRCFLVFFCYQYFYLDDGSLCIVPF